MDKDELKRIAERQDRWRKVPGLRLWFKPSRWPWQYKTTRAALDIGGKPVGEKWGWSTKLGGMGRFGGGWQWEVGIQKGSTSILLALFWGYVRVRWGTDPVEEARKAKEEREARREKDWEARMNKLVEAKHPSYTEQQPGDPF